ncbi:MAG TPA: gephyrin-like molybdotransferase Glp, partial [Longilinea sp.]|nr:gephyrin-like molybdotransferase Glp [Longilinea sp.]
MAELLSVVEAQNKILDQISGPQRTVVPFEQAVGLVLAEPIVACDDIPPFANSSMDGFAVRCQDTLTAPIELLVTGDIPAGIPSTLTLNKGEAVRIMTGAPLPVGADAVIPVEDTGFSHFNDQKELPRAVNILRSAKPGENVRPQGMDMHKDQQVLSPGRVLQPQDIGLFATLGVTEVPVFRPPKVAIIPSGDELLYPHQDLQPGKIRDANTYHMAAQTVQAGGTVIRLPIARDDPKDLTEKLDQAVESGADLILTSAGVSMGAFDFVRSTIETKGSVQFWKVSVRPGKPVMFGRYRGVPLIGLAGNPVSSFVGFLLFARPAIYKLRGIPPHMLRPVQVITTHEIESDPRE